jgi:hypothetical protein
VYPVVVRDTEYVMVRPARGGPLAGAKAHKRTCATLTRPYPQITAETAAKMFRAGHACRKCMKEGPA